MKNSGGVNGRRLAFERLESRIVADAGLTATLPDNVLAIRATEQDAVLSITESQGALSVARIAGSFPIATIREIEIVGSQGTDSLTIQAPTFGIANRTISFDAQSQGEIHLEHDGSVYSFADNFVSKWSEQVRSFAAISRNNVASIAFTPDGQLYGLWNDGFVHHYEPSANGWQAITDATVASMVVAGDGQLYAVFNDTYVYCYVAPNGWSPIYVYSVASMAVTGDGHLYVLRKDTYIGQVDTTFNDSVSEFSVAAMAVAGDGQLYALCSDAIIRRYDPSGSGWTAITEANIASMAVTGDGQLYVLCNDAKIRRYERAADPANDNFDVITPLANIASMLVAADGQLYALCNDSIIRRYDPAIDNFDKVSDANVVSMAVAADGQFYAFCTDARVRRFLPATNEWAVISDANIRSMAVAGDGRLYVLCNDAEIRRYAPAINNYDVVSGANITSMAVAGDGRLYVLCSDNEIRRYIPTSTNNDYDTISDANITSMAVAGDGRLYVLCTDAIIRRYIPTTTKDYDTISDANITSMAVAGDGRLYALCTDTQIRRYVPAGPKGDFDVLGNPNTTTMVVAADGRLYARTSDDRVRQLDAADNSWTLISPVYAPPSSPQGANSIEVRSDGGLYAHWTDSYLYQYDAPASQWNLKRGAFDISFNFNGISDAVQAICEQAAQRWESIIVGDLPDETFFGVPVDDLLIDVDYKEIDGASGTLALSGPDGNALRNGSFLPYHGTVNIDSADVNSLLTDGRLLGVITHEIGHVLGFGGWWSLKSGLLVGAGTDNPRFTGPQATAEYLAWCSQTGTVPVENDGVPVESMGGGRDQHWRESVFADELMTPDVAYVGSPMPISRMTVASFADIGYTVNMAAADDVFPSSEGEPGMFSKDYTPSFLKGADVAAMDDSGQQTIDSWASFVSAGPPQETGQYTSFSGQANSNPSLFAVGPTIAADGTLTFTPQLNVSGSAKIQILLYDLSDAGFSESAVQTFTIVITKHHAWYNATKPLDVTNDKTIATQDVADIIDYLNAFGAGAVPAIAQVGKPYGFLDVTGDDTVATNDVVKVIEYLNTFGAGEGESGGSDAAGVGQTAQETDAVLTLLAMDAMADGQKKRG